MDKKFKDVSDEELKAELDRRAAEQKDPRPRPLTEPDFRPLVACLEEGMTEIDKYGEIPKDFKHYVYEAAMVAIYGPKVFPWINKRMR